MNNSEIKHWILHNKNKVISVAVILALLIGVAVISNRGTKRADPLYGVQNEYKPINNRDELYTLITDYYEAYAKGDIETVEKLATPLSDMEKSYIRFLSEYLDSYDVKEVYSKRGADNYTYLLSVDFDFVFKDIEKGTPGLDFFYIYTNPKGELVINNIYRPFNQNYSEVDMQADIVALQDEFLNQDDVKLLKQKVQDEYNTVISENDEVFNFWNVTLKNGVKNWYDSYQAEMEAIALAEAEAEKKALEEAEAAKKAQEEAEAAKKAEEEAAAAAAAAAEAEAAAAAAAQENQNAFVPPFTAGQQVTAHDVLNIRQEMDANSTKTGVVLENGVITILADSDPAGWTMVEHNGRRGYIRTDLLQ